MKVSIHIVARLQNPTGLWEDTLGAEIPDMTYKRAAIARTIQTILAGGGLYREMEDSTQFISKDRIIDMEVTANAVALADNLDLAKATGAIKLV
jgi:hypothetical protein